MAKLTENIAIGSVQKNATEELRVALTHYKGHDLLDLRVYGKFGAAQTYMPTGKGVSFNPALISGLIELMQKAEAEATAKGLIGGPE